MESVGWAPVPYRMGMALVRAHDRGALLSEGVICEGFRLTGPPLDVTRLKDALAAVVRRHPVLRTSFRVDDGPVPRQRIAAPWTDMLATVTVAGSADGVLARAADYMTGPGSAPFDLTAGRLMRAALFTDGVSEHVLVVSVDHTTCDGLSFIRLMDDVTTAYNDTVAAATWSEPASTLIDYALAESAHLGGPDGDRLRRAWRERLDHTFPEMVLVRHQPWYELGREAGRATLRVDAEEYRAIRQAAAGLGATPYIYAVARLLDAMRANILTDGWSFVAPLSGRLPGRVGEHVGNLVTLAPVTMRPSGGDTLAETVRAVREGVLWAVRHQSLPTEQILAEVAPDDRRLTSHFRQIFISGQHRVPLVFDGVTAEPMPTPTGSAMFDLSVWITTSDSDLLLEAVYRNELLSAPMVESWLARTVGR